jgi:ABC-type uncharacterized transport system YnjBCD ATPase subunit
VAGPDRFVPPEKRNVGLMLQDFALFPHLCIRRGRGAIRNVPVRDASSSLARIADVSPPTTPGSSSPRVRNPLTPLRRHATLLALGHR